MDRLALSRTVVAAVLGLVGMVLWALVTVSATGVVVVGANSPMSTMLTNGTVGSLNFGLTSLYLLGAMTVAGVVLTLLEFCFYRKSFQPLSRQDDRFSTPAQLALAAIFAAFLASLCVIGFFVVAYEQTLCFEAGGPIAESCFNPQQFVALAALLIAAVIVMIIGYVGLVVGVWRLGERYREGMFKVGALLLLVPFASVVGSVIVVWAVRSVRSGKSLRAAGLEFDSGR